jgi:hypothetical protein
LILFATKGATAFDNKKVFLRLVLFALGSQQKSGFEEKIE